MSYDFFDRETVVFVMQRLGVDDSQLSGPARRAYYANVMDFNTFDSLSDPVDYFSRAMHIELEHGSAAGPLSSNVTGDDALTTARIVWTHISGAEYGEEPPFTPFPTYYDHLIWMEGLHTAAVKRKKMAASL